MKIAVYLAAVPKNKNELKIAVLKRFADGIAKCGDQVMIVNDHSIVNCDMAVMQGFVHNDISSPHLQLRKKILDNHDTLIIDSNLFQFANSDLANYYLRYSLNGIFPNTGFYFDNKLDTDRWEKISKKLNLQLKDYRVKGNHILICLQRVDGWSMCGNNVQTWLHQTVRTLRRFTLRPIVVRKHPGDRQQNKLIMPNGVTLSSNATLAEDLNDCHAVVTFNSSPGIAALVHGIPVYVTDPIPQRSQTYPVCNIDLSTIENPAMPDRTEWITKISQSHWNDDEVLSGEAWGFLKERLCILKPNLS